jgi:hypothetical protein
MRPLLAILLFSLANLLQADELKLENEHKGKFTFDTLTLGITTGYQFLNLKRPTLRLDGKQDTLYNNSPFIQLSSAFHTPLTADTTFLGFELDAFQIGASILATDRMTGGRYSEQTFNNVERQKLGDYAVNYRDYTISSGVYLKHEELKKYKIDFVQLGLGYKWGETSFQETESEFVKLSNKLDPSSSISNNSERFKTSGMFATLGLESAFYKNNKLKVAAGIGRLKGKYELLSLLPEYSPLPFDTWAKSLEISAIFPLKGFNFGISASRYWYTLASKNQQTANTTPPQIDQLPPVEQIQTALKFSLYANFH